MVSVTHSVSAEIGEAPVERLAEGLPEAARSRIEAAIEFAQPLYEGRQLGTGEDMWQHALGMALIMASLRMDADSRIAALLFAVCERDQDVRETLAQRFGATVAMLVDGLRRLNGLRLVTRSREAAADDKAPDARQQTEVLRKMLLALVEDIRVVVLRLASRVQTLRYFGDAPGARRTEAARESLDIYAPLANRLGVWQLKWELEDLSFRYLEPDTYKRIARQLDERRVEREQFIDDAIARVKAEVAALGITAEVYGRPKHIYSIWNKMRGKRVDFAEVYDVRALRVLVDTEKDCYTVLGIVHHLWQPIAKEFDDYISNPKGNDYRSLHTAVMAEDGRALEIQIRTHDMHRHAELGVAAHWRYKERDSGAKADSAYDDKIALLRQLLSWRDEVADGADWVEQFKQAALDDTIYVLTPQGRVIDLPRGATPIDFAYRLHSDLGHRCRGAKVDGHLVPLNTPLANGQRVEIVTTKQGGPSRDWLNAQLGYLASSHAKAKVKRWFAAQEEAATLAEGRAVIARELQREGATQANIEELAHRLGYPNADAMYLAAGRNEVGPRAVHVALYGEEPQAPEPDIQTRSSKAGSGGVLVVGVSNLLTQMGKCCKPVPPDPIAGFVTRGRGVSVHRVDCSNFANMVSQHPERVIAADWGNPGVSVYGVDIAVEANDRQGLLRDISDIFSREKINVTAVNTQSRAGRAFMGFTIEVAGIPQLTKALGLIRDVTGVTAARRA